MTISPTIARAVTEFHEYIRHTPEFVCERRITVEELIEQWLIQGEAVLDCGKDFRIFVSAVAVIFAQWQDQRFTPTADESHYDSCIPWSVTKAIRDDSGEFTTEIFDPYRFQARLCAVEESKESQLLYLLGRH